MIINYSVIINSVSVILILVNYNRNIRILFGVLKLS